MTLTHAPELVSVWTEGRRPVRLVWQGVRYLVTDQSTALREAVIHEALTHPASKMTGWRFQGNQGRRRRDEDVRRSPRRRHQRETQDAVGLSTQ
ncbi:hypothetical protein SAMN04515691_3429 [Leifsonia sp. 98AMF]|uniref:hypothetical protein n=1 Tax=unclassified Leifsonia TaxID=2663824 RepID=UPI00087A6F94|nr:MULTISPECIES: hypothetical protein [unclassified Leifsonia]SDJ32530.1 hypothetical protein SAMN04515684_3195 [Leifsonia sp. 466MF]SEN56468.1 hypothetical protein SAMN04515685_3552 [Leifsonia sp. 467MF]SDH07564.1 hypothetical protein SAMN04515690_0588 [Leifsonia sp. 197AMF]SDK47377.1 hypothetical protein SAMN04515683_3570 [Leifsonia sp. 157MF]SDN53664.1 hypothetical protein SAMN04515686_1380 [Leifsonia sp. 509MF]